MVGALYAVSPNREIASAYRALARHLSIFDHHGDNLISFNDAPLRKHSEVVKLFDKAIAAEKPWWMFWR